MRLFYAPGACSMASHIMLRELGIDCEYESVDLKTHKTEKGIDFYQINPKGYVPALVLDKGGVLTEGTAVLLYISELKSTGNTDRYRLVEWLVFIATELHKNFSPLFYPNSSADLIKSSKDKLGKWFMFVDKNLSNRQFLLDSGFSAADAYLFTILNWCSSLGVDLTSCKNLDTYIKNIQSRPSVQQVLKEEGL
jgi:glutathione S-transferase